MLLRKCLSPRFHQTFRSCLYHYRLMCTRRTNPLGIQMLSSKLHEQLFSSVGEPKYSDEDVEKSKLHLERFELGTSESETLDDIKFDLPPLESKNLVEHFQIIAKTQSKPYADLIHQLIQANVPLQPQQWKKQKGWTKFVFTLYFSIEIWSE